MIYSLVNVLKIEEDKTVSGTWLQDHIGTLESATQRAIDIEEANHNALDIAVVANTMGSTMPYKRFRLDEKREYKNKLQ